MRRATLAAILVLLPACEKAPVEPTLELSYAIGEHGGGPPASVAFYSARDGNLEIYVMHTDGSEPQRVTEHAAEDTWPDLSPNGRYVTYASTRSGNREIYVQDLATRRSRCPP